MGRAQVPVYFASEVLHPSNQEAIVAQRGTEKTQVRGSSLLQWASAMSRWVLGMSKSPGLEVWKALRLGPLPSSLKEIISSVILIP